MIHKKIKISKSAVLLGTAMLFTISPAYAGFEWTPPPAPEKVMMAPATAPTSPGAAPAPMVESRAIKDKRNMATMAAPEKADPANQISNRPPAMMEQPAVATVSPVSGMKIPAQKAATEYEEVQGFGTDIPLVTAMSQIVPANFAYSVDDSSLLGQRVSWTGGAAWNKVLEKAVEPLGLEAVVSENTVWLRERTRKQEATRASNAEIMTVPSAPPIQTMKPSSSMIPKPPMAAGAAAPQPVITEQRSARETPRQALKDEPSSMGYQRRNPIPMMMKAGESEASDAPQPMTAMSSVPEANPVVTTQSQQNTALLGTGENKNYRHVLMAQPHEELVDRQSVNSKLDPFEIKYWTAEKGDSLRNVLTDWGQSAGTKIHWTSPYDYRLPFALKTHATFPDAVTRILTFYKDLEPRPVGRLHPNLPNGPSVLVIENYGTMVN